MLLATLIVGGLKLVTNVDCPWDLAGFGGHNPYVALFADRPDALPRAQCFPGAHASSASRCSASISCSAIARAALALWMLAAAIAVGIAFSIGQEARGAHFLSHDLTSAAIVWFVQLGLYACYQRRDQIVAAATESIEFVQEHLAEIAMDNRYATLPLWSRSSAEADAHWQFATQVAYAKTQTGALTIDGPMVSVGVSRQFADGWRLTGFAFFDDLNLKSGVDHRPLEVGFVEQRAPRIAGGRGIHRSFGLGPELRAGLRRAPCERHVAPAFL